MKKYGIFLLTFFFTFFLVTCNVKTIGHSSNSGDTSNLTTLLEFKFQNEVLGLSKDKIKTL